LERCTCDAMNSRVRHAARCCPIRVRLDGRGPCQKLSFTIARKCWLEYRYEWHVWLKRFRADLSCSGCTALTVYVCQIYSQMHHFADFSTFFLAITKCDILKKVPLEDIKYTQYLIFNNFIHTRYDIKCNQKHMGLLLMCYTNLKIGKI